MNEVADVIADLPHDERIITGRLRALILEADPRLQEKLSYGVPYFFHNRRVCFIWPASLIPCNYTSKEPSSAKVTLGLCYGNLLSNEQGLLKSEGRKQVYTIAFSSVSEIKDKAIREIILEAIMVDDDFGKTKKKR